MDQNYVKLILGIIALAIIFLVVQSLLQETWFRVLLSALSVGALVIVGFIAWWWLKSR